MLVPALFVLAAAAGGAEATVPARLSAFTEEASAWLLEGEELPPDYRLRLLMMPPADRLQAIVFLRRAGLLTEGAWSLSDLLKPAPSQESGQ